MLIVSAVNKAGISRDHGKLADTDGTEIPDMYVVADRGVIKDRNIIFETVQTRKSSTDRDTAAPDLDPCEAQQSVFPFPSMQII